MKAVALIIAQPWLLFLYQENEEPKKETTTSTKSTEKDPESDESAESDIGM